METQMLNVVFNTDKDALYYMQGFLKSWEEMLSDSHAAPVSQAEMREAVRHLRQCAAARTLHREGGDD